MQKIFNKVTMITSAGHGGGSAGISRGIVDDTEISQSPGGDGGGGSIKPALA